mgnify:CR=1 FL=1
MEAYPISLAGLGLALGLDWLAVAARAALLNASLARLLAARDENTQPVNRVLTLLHSPHILQAGLNLTQLLTRFCMAWMILRLVFYSTVAANIRVWLSAGFLLLGALVVFLVEWLTELLVSRHPEQWALRLAPYARTMIVLLSPLMVVPWFLTRKRDEQEAASTVTEDELKSMLDASHEGGLLEQDERQMIYSIFALGDTLAREIMVPRIYITALDVSISPAEAVDALLQSGHSRVPVYEETVDNIIGLLYAKDLLRAWREGGEHATMRSLLRPAYFIPEAKKVDVLLEEMQAEHVHMAIVVDEYGGVSGAEPIAPEAIPEPLDPLEDGPPVLFRQRRAAMKGGRFFDFLKFRSMVKGAEAQQAELSALDLDVAGGRARVDLSDRTGDRDIPGGGARLDISERAGEGQIARGGREL